MAAEFSCPGRSAARSTCGAVRCRAGAVTNSGVWYGPGSAKQREERCIAPGTRILSVILQQPLDVIEFDLRALRIAEAAAQFLENPAHPLHVDFAGDLDRQVVAEF